tara:strand:- start:1930 stop:2208 length:279 start_codon:yes stop_codon:yes gene_type:complete
MSDGKLNTELGRAAEAQAILSNTLFKEALETLRSSYTDAWLNSPARDEEGREKIYQFMQALKSVEDHLVSVVQTGELAKTQLEDLRTRKRLI